MIANHWSYTGGDCPLKEQCRHWLAPSAYRSHVPANLYPGDTGESCDVFKPARGVDGPLTAAKAQRRRKP